LDSFALWKFGYGMTAFLGNHFPKVSVTTDQSHAAFESCFGNQNIALLV
jgi:hypothetical protein